MQNLSKQQTVKGCGHGGEEKLKRESTERKEGMDTPLTDRHVWVPKKTKHIDRGNQVPKRPFTTNQNPQ